MLFILVFRRAWRAARAICDTILQRPRQHPTTSWPLPYQRTWLWISCLWCI